MLLLKGREELEVSQGTFIGTQTVVRMPPVTIWCWQHCCTVVHTTPTDITNGYGDDMNILHTDAPTAMLSADLHAVLFS